MPAESLNCNRCGTALEVGPTTNFVTCSQCGTRLAVKRTASSAFTEEADDAPLRQIAGTMQEQLGEIKQQNAVAQLDREWMMEREQYMITGRYGRRHLPTQGMSLIGGIVIVAFGLLWTAFAATITQGFGPVGTCFPLFGVVFVLAGLAMSIYSYAVAGRYRQAYHQYQRRRAALLAGRPDPGRADVPGVTELPPRPAACLRCGKPLVPGASRCPDCNWSYES